MGANSSSFHRAASAAASSRSRVAAVVAAASPPGPITLAYLDRVASGNLRVDNDQLITASVLDDLYDAMRTRVEIVGVPDRYVEALAERYGGGGGDGRRRRRRRGAPWRTTTGRIANAKNATLDDLAALAISAARAIFDPPPIRGAYVYGSVGVGKSMLVDMFHSICSTGRLPPSSSSSSSSHDDDDDGEPTTTTPMTMTPIRGGTKRRHFHEFMLDVHGRIHRHRLVNNRMSDPIPPVAASIARETRLLCLDEMQITDIADAMIMRRLMTLLFDLGVVVVTTSNRPPWGLYEGGINRVSFLPFIDTLNERMVVIGMGGTHDYRRDRIDSDADASSESSSSSSSLPRYLCPSVDPSPASRLDVLERWFASGGGESRNEAVPVVMGRSITSSKSNDSCATFDFDELCHRPLGAADYIALASRFDTIIVTSVPRLTGEIYDRARRFVVLVDAAYEARTRLIIDAEVSRDELFVGFDASVTTNDGDEEIAVEEDGGGGGGGTTTTRVVGGGGNEESMIVGEGGSSSSSSTTFVKTENGDGRVEWSATGRVGVSLAQLSAVREVSFSFRRAESRLAEMASSSWGR